MSAAEAVDRATPPELPLPELIVRGSHVRLDRVQTAPGQVVPVLAVRSTHVEVQLALQDGTVDQLIDALTEVRRTRRGLTVASELPSDRLPGRSRSHP